MGVDPLVEDCPLRESEGLMLIMMPEVLHGFMHMSLHEHASAVLKAI